MHENTGRGPEPTPAPKQSYTTPELLRHGTVETITRGQGSSGGDGLSGNGSGL